MPEHNPEAGQPMGEDLLRKRDPMYGREKEKYEHPIASREYILDYLAALGKPATIEEIATDLQVPETDLEALGRRLRAMERDGQLVRNRRDAYGIPEAMELIRGTVSAHADGFGFLIPDDGSADLFLSPREMRKVLHGDTVLGRVVGKDRRGRPEGGVVRVLERGTTQVVGRFFEEDGVTYVVPDDNRIGHDFVVSAEGRGGALHGQIVTIEITRYPDGRGQPQGRVAEVLGDHMAPGMEVEIAIRNHGLPHRWPEEVLQEAAAYAADVPETMKAGRLDLRHLPLVTIDGVDARDFDDAVYAEAMEGGFRLYVAIADVATYVLPGSALDQEGLKRGNSVYFPNRVIPMLPEALSNGLCSLNPGVDRLALACEMEIGDDGSLRRFRFGKAVMRSHRRFTYDEVAAILAGDRKLRRQDKDLVPHLEILHALYAVLTTAREARGAIEFETQEARIIYGPESRIERIEALQRNVAHRIIEECMLAANVCAAQFFRIHEVPMLYRVHPEPPADKLEDLRRFLGELGVPARIGTQATTRDFARILEAARGRKDYGLVQTVVLRSLSQAFYTAELGPHFGLAYPAYTHFTSPIRRYPDLIVHRGIHRLLEGKGAGDLHALPWKELQGVGQHCSMTERRADEASRDAVNWLKCEFMLNKVGENYDGIITGVTGFGLFVALKEVFVEGLVHISTLGEDYFHFDAERYRLIGERTKRIFQLGDEIRVRVQNVNLDETKIDFELADEQPAGRRRKKRRA